MMGAIIKRALTLQQKSVCDLIALGLSSKEISTQLRISHRTVDAHRAEVFRKMGVRNAVELVRMLLNKGEQIHG